MSVAECEVSRDTSHESRMTTWGEEMLKAGVKEAYVRREDIVREGLRGDCFFSRVRIGPDLAEEWLKTKNFRSLNAKNLQTLKAALLKGEWRVNAEAIKIHRDGGMIDGQHRMRAVIETGVAIESWVAFNCSEILMDVGAKRTLKDYIRHEGFSNASTMQSAVIRIDVYREDPQLLAKRSPPYKKTVTSLLDAYRQEFPLIEIYARLAQKASGVCSSGTLAFILYEACKGSSEVPASPAEFFVTALRDGAYKGQSIRTSDATHWLREILACSARSGTKTAPNILMANMILAWNKTVTSTQAMDKREIQWKTTGPKAKNFPLITAYDENFKQEWRE